MREAEARRKEKEKGGAFNDAKVWSSQIFSSCNALALLEKVSLWSRVLQLNVFEATLHLLARLQAIMCWESECVSFF